MAENTKARTTSVRHRFQLTQPGGSKLTAYIVDRYDPERLVDGGDLLQEGLAPLRLRFDYPVAKPVEMAVSPSRLDRAWTRAAIARAITSAARTIYSQEARDGRHEMIAVPLAVLRLEHIRLRRDGAWHVELGS